MLLNIECHNDNLVFYVQMCVAVAWNCEYVHWPRIIMNNL